MSERLSRSRVILGRNCSNPGIRVKDYSFHPDFKQSTYSTPALIQLETNYLMTYLQPICAPPRVLVKPLFYVMTIDGNVQCNAFDRLDKLRYNLDVEKMWPIHTVCAKALTGAECIWRSGAVLALRQNNKWSLVGFGIYGPGCRAPSRFLEYSQYRPWVRSSIAGIGKPTISRISKNHVILRRSLSNVQRYGPCDIEEVRSELFTDRTVIERGPSNKRQRVRYNVSITDNKYCYHNNLY
ncbi:uncharacterized protein LOC124539213 [Vanessa cardui]|uniref:uncharacterized protein LOC124539213 n=1 Tax=Vanessa cardui TaxID=171605 RepID=UPI001F141476|nr:uncharacterized protein LOC124539213 [Vanessa cardui]